jgi:cytochrome P450
MRLTRLGKFHAWVSMIYETVKAGALEQATRRFAEAGSAFQNFLLWCLPSAIREKRKAHLRQSTEKVMRRLEKDTDHRDFIWYILKQKAKFDIAQDEIIVNAALFIVAGSETTANLLSGLIARLLRNPTVFAKLKAEIRALRADELTYEKLKALPYLNACLEEGLRIHPVSFLEYLKRDKTNTYSLCQLVFCERYPREVTLLMVNGLPKAFRSQWEALPLLITLSTSWTAMNSSLSDGSMREKRSMLQI